MASNIYFTAWRDGEHPDVVYMRAARSSVQAEEFTRFLRASGYTETLPPRPYLGYGTPSGPEVTSQIPVWGFTRWTGNAVGLNAHVTIKGECNAQDV